MAQVGLHARGLHGLPEGLASVQASNAGHRYVEDFEIGDRIYTIRENLSKQVHGDTMGNRRVSPSVFEGEGTLARFAEHLLTALCRDPDTCADEAAAGQAGREADGHD